MLNNTKTLIMSISFFLIMSFFSAVFAADYEDSNPIDKYVDSIQDTLYTQRDINRSSECYLEAWKTEFENIYSLVLKGYEMDYDRTNLKKYRNLVVDFAEISGKVEMTQWCAPNEQLPDKRTYGTGMGCGVSCASAGVYKYAALDLIYFYENQSKKYKWVFDKEKFSAKQE